MWEGDVWEGVRDVGGSEGCVGGSEEMCGRE